MIETDHLIYEKDGAIATMTFNRPQARNAISLELGQAMGEATADFEADEELRVLIVTGAGDVAFCSGGDLKTAIPQVTSMASQGLARPATGTSRPFSGVTKPVIAAVNGYALAGGMELLLGTDIRVASEHATFGLPEPHWGLVPFAGSHVRLPQQVPWARAMEILLTGDPVTASEALAIGLINRVVPHADLVPTALAIAGRICRNGPLAVRMIKQAVLEAYNHPWEEAFAIESKVSQSVLASDDAKEGPRAFAEKREPRFTGR
ncbi:MAG TPA: enoyl-CoA hydratase-related protein [Trebonia sp.]|nr:enoyl-CoA hydratase-related protein [Trebonia sp.]